MAAHGGPYDITIDFGFRLEQDEDPNVEVQVSMSWEHAIAMVAALQRVIEAYEDQVPTLNTIREKIAEAEIARGEADGLTVEETR